MLRVYDLRRTSGGFDVVTVDVYRFRGTLPILTIKHWLNTGRFDLTMKGSCLSIEASEELRRFAQFFESPHWRNFLLSQCMQEKEDMAASSLFDSEGL